MYLVNTSNVHNLVAIVHGALLHVRSPGRGPSNLTTASLKTALRQMCTLSLASS
jgi:hypothetical protein